MDLLVRPEEQKTLGQKVRAPLSELDTKIWEILVNLAGGCSIPTVFRMQAVFHCSVKSRGPIFLGPFWGPVALRFEFCFTSLPRRREEVGANYTTRTGETKSRAFYMGRPKTTAVSQGFRESSCSISPREHSKGNRAVA